MDWCDTSVVDWGAVGAVGTWVVGCAAVWVALQANKIAGRLRREQEQRDATAARAMLSGVRLEAREYARRLKDLGVKLDKLRLDPGGHPAKVAQLAFESMVHVGFSDFGHRASEVRSLPQKIADDINWLYARERINRAKFVGNAEVFKNVNPVRSDASLTFLLRDASQDLDVAAQKVADIANRMSAHLGLPEDA